MPYAIRLPNGALVQNIPDEISQEEAKRRIIASGLIAEQTIDQAQATEGGFFPAIKRGALQTGMLLGDVLPAMVARGFGADEYAERQLQEAAETQARIQREVPAAVPSFTDISSLGDAWMYAKEAVGESLVSIIPSLITGGVAGLLARPAVAAANQAAKEAAERTLMSAAMKAGPPTQAAIEKAKKEAVDAGIKAAQRTALKYEAVGGLAGSAAQNIPEVYQNILEETGKESIPAALIAGGFNAALDSILPISLLAKMRKQGLNPTEVVGAWYKRGAQGLGKGFLIEGATESAQEASSIAAENFVGENKEFFTPKNLERVINAGLKGGLGGGVITGVTDIATGRAPAPEISDRQRAEQLQREILGEVETARAEQLLAEQEAAERARLEALKPPSDDEIIDMARSENGYGKLENAKQRLMAQEQTAEVKSAIQTIQDIQSRIVIEEQQRRVPSIPAEMTDEVIRKTLGFAKSENPKSVYQQLIGKSASDPDVLAFLRNYADTKAAPQTKERINKFLERTGQTPLTAQEIAQGEADAGQAIGVPGGAGVAVAGEPGAGAAAPGVGITQPSGVVPSVEAVEQSDVGEGTEQPSVGQIISIPLTDRDAVEQHAVKGYPIIEAPLNQLSISMDVPQFKSDADKKGIVKPLEGKFERIGVAPIQLWRRLDGRLEVISGRHRFDLAQRTGETTIPAQIHDEASGFGAAQAATLDAELNIRDEQGEVKDYVVYFENSGISEADAKARGLLGRTVGQRGWAIASKGSPELVAAHRSGVVPDDAAAGIATLAPNDSRIQAVGLRAVQDNKSTPAVLNTVQAVQALATERGAPREEAGDLFGFDDSAIKEAEEMARIATDRQRSITSRLSAITGAANKPAVAKAEGIDIKDEQALNKRIQELKNARAAWNNWSTNPALIKEIRDEMQGISPVEPELPPVDQAKPLASLRDAIAAAKTSIEDQIKDWSSRVYKANKAQIELTGDGPSRQGSMSISQINESKRRRAVEGLSAELNAVKKLEQQLADPEMVERLLRQARNAYADAEQGVREGTARNKDVGLEFESILLDRLNIRPPRGSYTSNNISKAIRKVVESLPADVQTEQAVPAKPLEGQAAKDAEQAGEDLLSAFSTALGKPSLAPSPPPKPVKLSKETEAKITELGKVLQRILGKFGLKNVALSIEQDLRVNGEYANRLIKLALDADSPVRDLRHESLHAMKELGFFSDAQWKTLEKFARDKWIDKYLKNRVTTYNGEQMSRYDAYMRLYNGSEDAVIEEAIADAFGDFDITKPPAGLMQTLLRRMRDLFRGIKESMGIANIDTAEDIFRRVEKGELREGVPVVNGEPERLSLRIPEDYRGEHRAPLKSSGSPAHDLTDVYPEDVYGPNGPRYYGHYGNTDDNESFDVIRRVRNKPNVPLTIYRAVPKSAPSVINDGDWVTISKKYAKLHGESALRGDYKIISKLAHPRDIFTNGDSIHEWGYDPQPRIAGEEAKALGYKASLRVMRGEERPELGKKTTVDMVGKYFDDQIIKEFGGKLNYNNSEHFDRAVKQATEEVQYQIKNDKSGLDWYEEDIHRAFKDTAKVLPDLKSKENRILFSVMAGIMSPQTIARDNWLIAAKAFEHYINTGNIPGINPENGNLWMGGTQSPNKKVQLEFLDKMVKDLGQKNAIKWMMTPHTVKEINEFRSKYGNIKSGIDGKATEIKPGLYAFGPKIGPFVSNINGIHDVTVDKWFTRTFNRYFGTMIGPDGKIVDAPTEPQRRFIKELANKVAENAGIKNYQVQSLLWFYEQRLFTELGAQSPSYGFSDGAVKFLESRGKGGGAGVAVPAGPTGAGGVKPAPKKQPKYSLRDASLRAPQTEAFKRWFGNSKVVNENGEPLVVYRGTDQDYGPTMRVAKEGALGAGIYTTPNPEFASSYAEGDSANVMPLYVSLQNPLVLRHKRNEDPMILALTQLGMPSGKAETLVEKAYEEKGYIGKQVMNRALSQGYDGIMQYRNGELTEVVAFSPYQIKSAIGNVGTFDVTSPDIRYSLRDSLGLYSELENKISQGPNKAAAPAWKAYINALPQKGVKPEEIEWSGVRDWLDLQTGPITKDAVNAYLKQGGVRVEETVLSSAIPPEIQTEDISADTDLMTPEGEEANKVIAIFFKPTPRAAAQEWKAYDMDIGVVLYDEYNNFDGAYRSLDEAKQFVLQKAKESAIEYRDETTYGRYTLPGGENYREVLLTLPNKKADRLRELELRYNKGEKLTLEERKERHELLRDDTAKGAYQSSHWEKPNVIAHIRLNDRTDRDGNKVLFVEEIQSDWGQEGKKKGFKYTEQQFGEIEKRLIDLELQKNLVRREGFRVPRNGERIEDADPNFLKYQDLQRQYDAVEKQLEDRDRPALAPFVTKTEGWLNLALKRIMVMAGEGGYDKVAFITGAQSHKRFPEKESGESTKESFKTFYDSIVPIAVKKLLPKVGGGQIVDVNLLKDSMKKYDKELMKDDLRILGEADFRAKYAHDQQPGFAVTPDMQRKVETTGLPRFSLRDDLGPRMNLRSQIDPAINARIDQTTFQRPEKGFIRRMMEAISPKNFSSFRASFLNRYNYLSEIDKEKVRLMGGKDLLADASAESAALLSDLGAGITASAMGVNDRRGGAPVYKRYFVVEVNNRSLAQQYTTRAAAQAAAARVNGVVRERGFTTVSTFNDTVKGPVAILAPLLSKYKDPHIFRAFQFYSGVKRGARFMYTTNAQGQVVEKLFDPVDIQKAQQLEKQFPEFVQAHKEWIAYNDKLVDFLMDTGVLSKERADIYKMHGDYFPFYRQLDESDDALGPKVFQSIAAVRPPKKLKGGEERLGDFFENFVRNTQSAVQAGVKNIASRRAADVGMDVGVVRPLPQGVKTGGPTQFTVLEDGEIKHYESNDMLFINAIKSLNLPDMPGIGIFSGPANLLRNLVTKDPGFILANLMRDSMSAWVTSGVKMTPIADTFANFGKSLFTNSKEFNALLDAGIIGGYEFSQNVETSAKKFGGAIRKAAGVPTMTEQIARPVTSVWNALERATTASDAATRMEVYKKTLAETGNEAEALYRALEMMNFNRKGSSAVLRFLTAAVPFLNARIQGLDLLYRAGINPMLDKSASDRAKEIQKTFFVRGAMIMGLSAAYWTLTHDDEDYKKQEQETRDNYWLLPSLGIKIPIPFEIGVIFKVIPERILGYTMGTDTGKDFLDSMKRQLLNTLAFNPIPQTLIPIVETVTDFSFFTWRQILPQGMENVAPKYQVGPGTSKLAEGIGKTIGASPIKIDQLINGYTGTMGMYAVDLMDAIFNTMTDSPKPSKRFEQMPVIRRFAVDPEARGTVTAYYDLKNAVDQVVRTMNLLEKSMNYEGYGEYMQENMKLLAARDYVLDMEKTLKELRESKNTVRVSTMDADVKRDSLTTIGQIENGLTSNIQDLKKIFR